MLVDSLPLGYGWVLFFVAIFGIQLIITGFAAMGPRKKYFTKAFFEQHFPQEVKDGLVDTKTGYPDTGNGVYSQKLSHAQWCEVNNAQRAHLNFLETFAPTTFMMLIAGLVFTRVTIVLQLTYIAARLFYLVGYSTKGPSGRLVGALMGFIALFGLIITSLSSAFTLGGGFKGLVDLLTGR